jgi:branched-chain amino acid transport system permease protein
MYAYMNTPLGRISNAVRDNPERCEFISYDPVRVRSFVVIISGFFAGLAGGLHALNWEVVSYETLGLKESAFVLFMVYIGGARYFYGPILGAVFVTFLAYYLSAFTEVWLIYVGFVFLIIVLFAPSGLAAILAMHKPLWKKKLLLRVISSYIIAILPGLLISISAVFLIEIIYRWSATNYFNPIISLSGIKFNARGFATWAIPTLGILIGGFLLMKCRSVIKKVWDQVSEK